HVHVEAARALRRLHADPPAGGRERAEQEPAERDADESDPAGTRPRQRVVGTHEDSAHDDLPTRPTAQTRSPLGRPRSATAQPAKPTVTGHPIPRASSASAPTRWVR